MENENVTDTNSVPTAPAVEPTPVGVNVFFENAEAALENLRNASIFVEAAGIQVDKVDAKLATRQFLGAIYNAIQKGLEDSKNAETTIFNTEATSSEVPAEATTSEVPAQTETINQ